MKRNKQTQETTDIIIGENIVANLSIIEKMEANNKWAWGFMLTLAVTVIGYILTRFGI